MTNQQTLSESQILEKAIQKAIDNGFIQYINILPANKLSGLEKRECKFIAASEFGIRWKPDGQRNIYNESVFDLIFNHSFAKALWGEEPYYASFELKFKDLRTGTIAGYAGALPAHQHHLQQMVIADDPIKYLGENLK